jgi:hypothetical protein
VWWTLLCRVDRFEHCRLVSWRWLVGIQQSWSEVFCGITVSPGLFQDSASIMARTFTSISFPNYSPITLLRYWQRHVINNHNNIELRQLVSLFLPRGSGFSPGLFHVVFMVHKREKLFSSTSVSRTNSHSTYTTCLSWDNWPFMAYVPRISVSAHSHRVYSQAYSAS